jgi:tetratricopeptide (TPR) repeat protein
VELAKEFGDDLQVILVECQGTGDLETERFTWDKGWMGGPAMWSSERPMNAGMDGIPHYVLLGNDGTVLSKGYSVADKSKVEDLIAEQVKARGDVPDDAPKSLKKAYTEFAKGKYQKAIEVAEKAIEKGDDAAAARELIDALTLKMERRLQLIERQLGAGEAVLAKANFDAFVEAARGVEAVADQIVTMTETFDSEETKREIEADETLQRTLKNAFDDGIDSKTAKKLEKLAEDYAGTKCAERAKHLATLVSE